MSNLSQLGKRLFSEDCFPRTALIVKISPQSGKTVFRKTYFVKSDPGKKDLKPVKLGLKTNFACHSILYTLN
jgi:hypothetical protein